MKDYKFCMKIIASVLLAIIGIYIFINIDFIFSVVDGKMYDGFGNAYINDKPQSKYTIIGYICIISGISLFISTNEEKKKKEILKKINNK